MRAKEFLSGTFLIQEAMAVREYSHPEEYLIRDGTDVGIQILEEFKDDLERPQQLNLKWDGKAALFWGRDQYGTFYMVPNNQWAKGQMLTPEQLASEIKNTGRKLPTQSQEEFALIRQQMASAYLKQWKLLEQSSPKQGFYWGDIMFDSPPDMNNNGQFEFTPNKITYVIDPEKQVGKAIQKGAQLFIAVHGLVPEFGIDPTSDLRPVPQSELDVHNKRNSSVILLSERPEAAPIKTNTKFIDDAIKILASNRQRFDKFTNYVAPKFTGFKSILRDYLNAKVKAGGKLDFDQFLQTSKLSENQRALALQAVQNDPSGWQSFEQSTSALISAKDRVFEIIQQSHGESMQARLGISAYANGQVGGEGFAKIRGSSGIKYVNPAFRQAPANARFVG